MQMVVPMKISKAIRALLTKHTNRNNLKITYRGIPVDILEACDETGFLTILVDQARLLSECTDPRNGWLQGVSLQPDPTSLTGRRVVYDESLIRDRVSLLLFMLEAMTLASEHAREPNTMDLGSIDPPRLPQTLALLGLTKGPELFSTFEEPARSRPALD